MNQNSLEIKMALSYLVFVDKSNEEGKKLLGFISSRIDHEHWKEGYPFSFQHDVSFYNTEIPAIQYLSPDAFLAALAGVEDKDMRIDLEEAQLINWCKNVSILCPVLVPKDGNCLLHAVAMAVWGLLDKQLLLRRLLCLTLSVDYGRFHSRWERHRQMQISQFVNRLQESSGESLSEEWKEICNCLEPSKYSSRAMPYRFLESIHVYALANILRRPIVIITDPSVRAFSGISLQDNEMGGVYLPLEWNWSQTCRTPLVFGYVQNHFSPLLVTNDGKQASQGQKKLVPLVTNSFGQLPVRFLLEQEEPEAGELLKKYLKVKETVVTINGEIRCVLCTELQSQVLPDELNLMYKYFNQFETPARNISQPLGYLSHGCTIQTNVQSPQHFRTHPLPLTGLQVGVPGSIHNVRDQSIQSIDPVHSMATPACIPPPRFKAQQNAPLQSGRNQFREARLCIRPGCKFFGDPDLAYMCSSCFKDYTIVESRRQAAAAFIAAHQQPSAYTAVRQPPSAPMPSIVAQEQQFETSMMPQRCLGGCGFRCSVKTYPYCHECAEKNLMRNAVEASSATVSGTLPAVNAGITKSVTSSGDKTFNISAFAALNMSTKSKENQPMVSVVPTLPTSVSSRSSPQLVKSDSQSRQEEIVLNIDPSVTSANANIPSENSAKIENVHTNHETGMASPSSSPSPTRALAAVNLVAPLTPPDDQELFGSGMHNPGPKSHGLSGTNPSSTEPSSTNICSQSRSLVNEPVKNQNVGKWAKNSSEKQSLESIKQHHFSGQVYSKCITEGCLEVAVHHNQCPKCYLSPDNFFISSDPSEINLDPKSNLSKNKEVGVFLQAQADSHSVSSSIPQSLGVPLNASPSYVHNWLHERPTGTHVLFPSLTSHATGFGEKQASEHGENDLIASGEACHSFTNHCVAPSCKRPVSHAGELCQECANILDQAKRLTQQKSMGAIGAEVMQSSSHSVPLLRQSLHNIPEPKRNLTAPLKKQGSNCIVKGCTYFGDPEQANMCSRHYNTIHSVNNKNAFYAPVNEPRDVLINSNLSIFNYPGSRAAFENAETGGSLMSFPQGRVSVPPPSIPQDESRARLVMSGMREEHQISDLEDVYNKVFSVNNIKCSRTGCANYGNRSNNGLCNECYKSYHSYNNLGEDVYDY